MCLHVGNYQQHLFLMFNPLQSGHFSHQNTCYYVQM